MRLTFDFPEAPLWQSPVGFYTRRETQNKTKKAELFVVRKTNRLI